MGGFCGVISKEDCVADLFFGTDYHSHLGTQRGGMAVLGAKGFQRAIHNIQNAPFRSKFENDFSKFEGRAGLGVISDTDPQPLIVASRLGTYAIVTVGILTNVESLMAEMFAERHMQFQYSTTSGVVSPTAVVAALIDSQDSFVEGVKYAQSRIEGSCSLMILTEEGRFYAARDRYGRTPIIFGKKDGTVIATQESCIFPNLGYEHLRDLGPGEMVEATPDGITTLIEPGEDMAICSFLWVYYGYPASTYEGRNVEMARYRCGGYLARRNPVEADSVGGVPDSGVAHALGYSQECGTRYARPFVKYTPTWPRSFMPPDQRQRDLIAHMKLIPIPGHRLSAARLRLQVHQLLAVEVRLRPRHAPLHPRHGRGRPEGRGEVPRPRRRAVQEDGGQDPQRPRPHDARVPAPRRPRLGNRPPEGKALHVLLDGQGRFGEGLLPLRREMREEYDE